MYPYICGDWKEQSFELLTYILPPIPSLQRYQSQRYRYDHYYILTIHKQKVIIHRSKVITIMLFRMSDIVFIPQLPKICTQEKKATVLLQII